MSSKSNRVGEYHGTFYVISTAGTKDGKTLWKCLCTVCHSITVRENRYFRKDRPVPKGCKKCVGKNHWLYKGYEEMSSTYLERIKKQAKDRCLEFSVTDDFLWKLYKKQNGKCYLTDLEIVFGKDQTASLDRIDSSIGYTEENVMWCHKEINILKGYFSLPRFIELCGLVKKEPNVMEVT